MKIYLLAALSAVILFSGCKKEPEPEPTVQGCTDSAAYNYNPSANLEDGSCLYNYSTTISFWHDYANYQAIDAATSTPYLQIFIDGVQEGGMMDISSYSPVEPPCGNGQHVVQVGIGNNQSSTVQFDIRYHNGTDWVVFQQGTINVTANGCTSQEIIF